MHDFTIKPRGTDKDGVPLGVLSMNIQAKTYWLSIDSNDKKVVSPTGANPPGSVATPTLPGGANNSSSPALGGGDAGI